MFREDTEALFWNPLSDRGGVGDAQSCRGAEGVMFDFLRKSLANANLNKDITELI